MASMSNYLENAILNHVFRTTAYTQPTTIAIALCNSAPDDTDTTLVGKEVVGTSYARVDVTRSDSTWNSPGPTNGTTANTNVITFPAAGVGGWGTITHIAICDSATAGAGNVLFWGALSIEKTVTEGDIFQFNAGQLSCNIDN